jgi:hypothetical protein
MQETYRPREIISKGAVCKTVFSYSCDSSSDQSISWQNLTPPSLTTVLSREFHINYSLVAYVTSPVWAGAGGIAAVRPSLVFNGIQQGNIGDNSITNIPNAPWPSGQNGADTGYDPAGQFHGISGTLRSYPFHQCVTSLQLFINGQSSSVSASDYAAIFPLTSKPYEKEVLITGTPNQPDLTAYLATQYDATRWGATARQPTAPNGGYGMGQSRASVLATVAANWAAGQQIAYQTYEWQLSEQLMISPLQFGDKSETTGLSNINLLSLNISLSNISRALVAAVNVLGGASAVDTVNTVTFGSAAVPNNFTAPTTNVKAPVLILQYSTQDAILESSQPETLYYSYSNLTPYVTVISTGTYGGLQGTNNPNAYQSGNVTLQSIRLSSIPQMLYIWIRPSKSALVPNTTAVYQPDAFMRITGMQINFDNRSTLFSSYSEYDLWAMSCRNGSCVTFQDWKYGIGSLIIVDITKDLNLPSSDCVGQSNKYSTLQVTLNFNTANLNYSQAMAGSFSGAVQAIAYEGVILVQLIGKCIISKSSCDYLLNSVSSAEVLALTSDASKHVSSKLHDLTSTEGGSVLGTAGRYLSKALDGISAIKPEQASAVQKAASSVSDALKSFGVGATGSGLIDSGNVSQGGAMVGAGARRRLY